MTFWDFGILVLAIMALLRAWFRGSLFERKRAYHEARNDWRSHLLTCALCLSFHFCLVLVTVLVVPAILLPAPWSSLCWLPLQGLAAVNVVHWLWLLEVELLNGKTKNLLRADPEPSANSGQGSA